MAIGAVSEMLAAAGYTPRIEDSLNRWNALLELGLLQLSLWDSSFLKKDYPGWIAPGLNVVTSRDRIFRIVFWNSQYGGTLREYFAILFYQTQKGIAYYKLEYTDMYAYEAIHTFKRKNGSEVLLIFLYGPCE